MAVNVTTSWPWHRRACDSDDTGSMFLAMLLVLIGAAMAALMVPALLIQFQSTSSDVRRLHALDAARPASIRQSFVNVSPPPCPTTFRAWKSSCSTRCP